MNDALRPELDTGLRALGLESALATPLLARRSAACTTLAERLFVLMMLGDDRAVAATHLLGAAAWAPTSAPAPACRCCRR